MFLRNCNHITVRNLGHCSYRSNQAFHLQNSLRLLHFYFGTAHLTQLFRVISPTSYPPIFSVWRNAIILQFVLQ